MIEDGLPAGGADMEGDARGLVDRALIALAWRSYVLAAVVEPLVAFAFFRIVRDGVDPTTLWIWVGFASLLFGSRAVLALRWLKVSKADWDRILWTRLFHLHSFATALVVWGGAALFFLPGMEPLHQAFLIAIICGVSGGAMAELCSYLPALRTNLSALLGPLALTCLLLLDGPVYTAIGALAVVYFLYLIGVGRDHERSIRNSYRLGFERQGLIRRLEASKEAAERANRAKSDFLANMSHELRTPLNAIIGFSEVIKSRALGDADPEKYREYAEHIHSSGEHLLMLVNGVLDLSKAEVGGLDLSEERFDLSEVAAACVTMLEPVAAKAGVEIALETPAGDALFEGDPLRLRQIVLNLLSNAIKFTPGGGRLVIALARRADGGLDLRVADSGIGMSDDQIDTALQPFAQLDQGYGKQFQGSGLGLPITRTLVELHGGTLSIDSMPRAATPEAEMPDAVMPDSLTPAPAAPGPGGVEHRGAEPAWRADTVSGTTVTASFPADRSVAAEAAA